MDLKRESDTTVVLRLEERELRLLYSCLRESFASLDWEYYILTGFELFEARKVEEELKSLMEREGVGFN